MVGKNIGEIKGPQNNFGNGALKVGRLGSNLHYKSIMVDESGVVEDTDNTLKKNDRIIQLENIEISGEILLDSSSIGLIESKLTENYGDGVVSLSRVLFDIIKDSRDTDDEQTLIIESNATAIESNATAIESNATNIESNATNIESNATAIESNATNIESNATAIELNATNIVAISDGTTKFIGDTEFTGMPIFTNGFSIGGPESDAIIKMLGEVKALTVDTTQLNIKDSVLTLGTHGHLEGDTDETPRNKQNDNVVCDSFDDNRRYYGMRVKIGDNDKDPAEKYKARQLSYDRHECKWTTGLVNASGTGDFDGVDVNCTDFTGIQLSHVEFADPRVAPKNSSSPLYPSDWLQGLDNDDTIRTILNETSKWTDSSDPPSQANPGNYKIQIIMHYTENIKLCRVGNNFVLEVALKSGSTRVDKETSMVKLSDLHPVIFRMIDLTC